MVKVLLVEDDEDDYVIVCDLLRNAPGDRYELQWAADYESAVQVMERERFDVLLVDYQLGAHTGTELVRQARRDDYQGLVILLTGHGGEEADRGALEAGANQFLDKNRVDQAVLDRAIRFGLREVSHQAQVRHAALHDALTGLPNRTLFGNRLEQLFRVAKRDPASGFALFFIDLDEFKQVNDTLGHDAGDRLLAETARRLQNGLRPGDTAARLGGDEFALLLACGGDAGVAVKVAERLQRALRRPVSHGDRQIRVTASIGIALYEPGMADPDTLVHCADQAMYQVKAAGRGDWRLYHADIHVDELDRADRESELRRALAEDQILLLYRPVVDLERQRLTGLEARVHWQHPRHGRLPPERFVPLAEASGLLAPLGALSLHLVATQLASWGRFTARQDDLLLMFHLGRGQLGQGHLSCALRGELARAGILPHQLILQFDDLPRPGRTDAVDNCLQQLYEMGVGICLDSMDLGSGLSAYLRRRPFGYVTLSEELFGRMAEQPAAANVLRGIVTLAHGLGARVLAQGLDDAARLALARAMGVDLGQGRLFGGPWEPAAVEERLRADPTSVP